MARREAFAALLNSGPVVLDGGLATHLEALGHDISGSLWSARVLADHPEAIVQVHRDFITAGAQIVITASYQVSRRGFIEQGRSASAADAALRRSVELAQQARADVGHGQVLVAASVGPFGAITHDGAEYRGRYGLSHDELVDFHAERIAVLAQAQPDVFAVETIPDAREAAAIGEVLLDYPDVPAWITFSCGDEARTWAGQPMDEAVSAATSAGTVSAIGVNCVHPALVTGLLHRIAASTRLPLVAYPNSGQVWLPDTETWSGSASSSDPWPVSDWREAGAQVIGGCCVVAPEQIAALALKLTEC